MLDTLEVDLLVGVEVMRVIEVVLMMLVKFPQ